MIKLTRDSFEEFIDCPVIFGAVNPERTIEYITTSYKELGIKGADEVTETLTEGFTYARYIGRTAIQWWCIVGIALVVNFIAENNRLSIIAVILTFMMFLRYACLTISYVHYLNLFINISLARITVFSTFAKFGLKVSLIEMPPDSPTDS